MSDGDGRQRHDYDDSGGDNYPRYFPSPSKTWIAPTILALGTLVTSLVTGWIALDAGREASAAKDVATETGTRVDGRMEEMLALARASAAAQATLEEKKAQREREANEAVAAAKPGKPDAVTAAAAQAVLDLAAKRAKQIVDDAAVEAERLLARERKPKGQQP